MKGLELAHISPTERMAFQVTTRFPVESDLEAGTVRRLSALINEVYDDAESGMWKRKGTRTDTAVVERLLRERALILAEIYGALVGSVQVSLMGEGVGEFGMLVADPGRRGAGIGTALVQWYTRLGYSPRATEQLETMYPNLVPELATECDFTVWHKPLT